MGLKYVDPQRRKTVAARALTGFGRTRTGQLVGKHVVVRSDLWLGRLSKGRLSWGMFNAPSAKLITTGAKSGQLREVQVAYFHDDRDVILIASNFGGQKNPDWYANLMACPRCTFGGEAFIAREVTSASGDMEYARLYALAEQSYSGFTDYRLKTALVGRHIPIVRLSVPPPKD
jgi:deazaflavin-dependent oxidoreductase (nitroreductase family)